MASRPTVSSIKTLKQCSRKIKLAADISMATTVGSRRSWSRAMLLKHKSLVRNRVLVRQRVVGNKKIINKEKKVKKKGEIRDKAGQELSRADKLRRLVPGGEAMDFCSLLEETAHYIKCLNTQIEELAFLIRDNLPCKHLVLSIEELLVDFLLNDTSPDGVLELEPMNPYNRLLLHRLADIFGFAHVSIGEGDDRHLILERSPESSIPPILVSDILWQHDEYQSPTQPHKLLRRKDSLPASKTNTVSTQSSLEEREAAYLAARQRIFSVDESEIKESVTPKPRNVPVVARRMIAHALGQKICSNSSGGVTSANNKEHEEPNVELGAREANGSHQNLSLKTSQETTFSSQKVGSYERKNLSKPETRNASISAPQSEREVQKKPAGNKAISCGAPQNGRTSKAALKDNLKQEHLGAAKRMFAHALGLNGAKEINGLIMKCNETKSIDKD
ncbi:Single-stranded nucleic acid binding R3H [Macleaya cordata]|uniref:Single-stranded nucleic acid binding R3H n=1 Tax=Macleaya cordata TaxID=56857 RepID=A0A200R0K3_MACCD|nr:Single-stranded nucleic acid binding R3H [Macleaya cordata]